MPYGGPVLGLAESLTPALETLKCLQPFKFIMIGNDDYQRLGSLIRSSVGRKLASPALPHRPSIGRRSRTGESNDRYLSRPTRRT